MSLKAGPENPAALGSGPGLSLPGEAFRRPRSRREPEGQGLATGSTVEATETGEAAAALNEATSRVNYCENSRILPVLDLRAMEVAELMMCFAVGKFRASFTKP